MQEITLRIEERRDGRWHVQEGYAQIASGALPLGGSYHSHAERVADSVEAGTVLYCPIRPNLVGTAANGKKHPLRRITVTGDWNTILTRRSEE